MTIVSQLTKWYCMDIIFCYDYCDGYKAYFYLHSVGNSSSLLSFSSYMQHSANAVKNIDNNTYFA